MGYIDHDGDYQIETMTERYARYRKEDEERAERNRQRLERYKREDDARHNDNMDFIFSLGVAMLIAVLAGMLIALYATFH